MIYEGDETGWDAIVPELDVFATAKTRPAVETMIKDAVSFHIEGLRERGEPVPEPRGSFAGYVDVA